jgi:putative ABC transport system permease protein
LPEQRQTFYQEALARIRALPGVEAAGTIDDLPLTPGSAQGLELEGYPPPQQPIAVQVRQVTPGYLRAMGIPVIQGRDAIDGEDALLVSREAARLYWGTDDPLGRRARLPALSPTQLRTVVGVVGDVKQRSLGEGANPTVYFSTREPYARATFAIRTSMPPEAIARSAMAAVHAVDAAQPVYDVRTMVDLRDETLTSNRLSALVLALFAAMALLLAAVGIYSVLAYIVRGRSREIGIRVALGAQATDVMRLIVGEGMSPVLVGIAVGLLGALAAARVAGSLVFGMTPSEPRMLFGAGATLVVVALVASVVPTMRALRLDAVDVMRTD